MRSTPLSIATENPSVRLLAGQSTSNPCSGCSYCCINSNHCGSYEECSTTPIMLISVIIVGAVIVVLVIIAIVYVKKQLEALEEQQWNDEHQQDGVVIGYKFNLYPPFHCASCGHEHEQKMKEQLDKINNSKHEFNLYKELYFGNGDEHHVVFEGPTIQDGQDVNTFDFRYQVSDSLNTSDQEESQEENQEEYIEEDREEDQESDHNEIKQI